MGTEQLKKIKRLQKENERLRRAVSDQTLDKLILKEAASGNFRAPYVGGSVAFWGSTDPHNSDQNFMPSLGDVDGHQNRWILCNNNLSHSLSSSVIPKVLWARVYRQSRQRLDQGGCATRYQTVKLFTRYEKLTSPLKDGGATTTPNPSDRYCVSTAG